MIGIVGSGHMGTGITQVCAVQGFDVCLVGRSKAKLEAAKQKISRSVTKKNEEQEKFGRVGKTEEILSRLRFSTDMNELAKASVVIESVSEDRGIKAQVFKEIESIVESSCLLLSNTSSISISWLANNCRHEQRVAGLHFMNPAHVINFVEIIRGKNTSEDTISDIKVVASMLGKDYIISQDSPGFVVNRILFTMINEAFIVLGEGRVSAEDIDKAMKLGTNQPMGPLALADLIGLDVCYAILEEMAASDERYKPSACLVHRVFCGCLGKKTGLGVYNYK